MAEGWARHFWAERVEAESAGTKPKGLDPLAIEAMLEAGVDISGQASKGIDSLKSRRFDLVITVCSDADENCPLFPGAPRVIHAGFDDPPRLARSARSREEALSHYRRVRDEIRDFVKKLPDILQKDS
ncbi:MAG: arsenate reductase ArsC [Candidatus Methylomirabilis sp.]|nr:arsenate reductase ArsC [Deltaproteobacteria bacterium]